MKLIRILCLLIISSGIGLFLLSYFALRHNPYLFPWCIGLACALIILGLGYLINTLLSLIEHREIKKFKILKPKNGIINPKEKAGYLVSKIMQLLLCIYALILSNLNINPLALILSVALIIIQYLLDLFLQLFYYSKRDMDS